MSTQTQTLAAQAHEGDHVPHVLPLKAYLGVAATLLALTGITVAVSYFDFGTWNLVVAMLVTSTKALLVAAVFMHLAFEKRKFNAIVILVSAIFLVIFMAFTLIDTRFRGMNDSIEGERPRDSAMPFAAGKPDTQSSPAPSPPAAQPPASEPAKAR